MKKIKFLFILLPFISTSSIVCCSKVIVIDIKDISNLSFVYDTQENIDKQNLKELIFTKIKQENKYITINDYIIEDYDENIFKTGGKMIVRANESSKLIKGHFKIFIRISINNIEINILEKQTKQEVEEIIQSTLTKKINKNIKKDLDYTIEGLNDIVQKDDNIIVKAQQDSKYIFGIFKLKITAKPNKLIDISNIKISLIVKEQRQTAEEKIFETLKGKYKEITKNDYTIEGLNDIVQKNDNIIVKANDKKFTGSITAKLFVSISNIEVIAKVGQKLEDVLNDVRAKINEIEDRAKEDRDYEIEKEGFGSSDHIAEKQKITIKAKKDSEYITGKFNVLISISIKSIIVNLDDTTNEKDAKQLILNEVKVYQKLISEDNWMINYEIEGLKGKDDEFLKANQQIKVIAKKDSKLLIDDFTINVKKNIYDCKIDIFVGESKQVAEEKIYNLLKEINKKIEKPKDPLDIRNVDYYLTNFEIKLDNKIIVVAVITSKYISGSFIIQVKDKK